MVECDLMEISRRSFLFSKSNPEDSKLDCSVLCVNNEEIRAVDDMLKLRAAAELLANGDIVGMPTETVYGLAANAMDDRAVKKIFEAKNRPSDNPLIVHISSIQMALEYCCDEIPKVYRPLIEEFWPGPLTILVKKKDSVPISITGANPHIQTIGIRFPSNEITRALIQMLGKPIAAPSANLSGKPSPTIAQHVYDDLKDKIPLIISDIDSSCDYGLESTVVDALSFPPIILRPGSITLEMIRKVEGFENVVAYQKSTSLEELVPTTPGMKYRHYSPEKAQVILVEHGRDTIKKLDLIISEYVLKSKCKIGIIRNIDIPQYPKHSNCSLPYRISSLQEGKLIDFFIQNDPDNLSYAKFLFHALRYLDEVEPVDYIVVHGVLDCHLGLAVMNRLRKAAKFIE